MDSISMLKPAIAITIMYVIIINDSPTATAQQNNGKPTEC